jgi:tRNA threonylcarbamoyladenosine biosynthesis protein TsaB
MDAKRKHLYCALYRFNQNGQLDTIKDQCLLSYEELVSELNEMNEDVMFVGDGIAVAMEILQSNLTVNATFAPAHMNSQRAASVAMAAIVRAQAGEIMSADALKPDYLRPSQAERELSEKMNQSK